LKKLSVIIVSYNVKYYVEQNLNALRWALRDIDSEIFVVDNHSRDGSVDYLRNRFESSITLISSNHNLGFARANNRAIEDSDSEYVLLLNPDTIVTEESMKETIAFMDSHPKAGALGVRMLKSDGTNAMESRRGVPTPMTAFYKMCGLSSMFPKSPRFGHYYMSGISWDEPHQIEIISGAFCLLRRKALDEVGLLDEDFFMYGEDVDLSYRILQGGWENWYVPSVILHYKGESTQKSSFRYVHVFYDAMLKFFRKHYGNMLFLITLPIKAAIIGRASMALINMFCRSCRDSIGLRRHSQYRQPVYVFIGTKFTINQCRQIAKYKGLDAVFYEGTIGTMPNGHLDLDLPTERPLVVVYDVHAFQYAQIFDIFARGPQPQVTIGTYDNNTHKIITQTEVIFDNSKRN